MIKRFLNFLFDDTAPLSMSRLMVKGLTWLMIGVLIGRLSVFITRIVGARLLGKIALGQFGLIDSTVTMFVGYAGLGMVVAISKNLAESFQPDPQRAGRILGTVCLISGSLFLALLLAFLLCSKSLVSGLSLDPDSLSSLRLGALLSLQLPSGLATAIFNSFQAFRQASYANIIQGLSGLALTLALVPIWGLNGYILAFSGGFLLMFIYQVVVIFSLCRKYHIHVNFKGITKELSLIWRFGLPSMLGGLLGGPIVWGTRALVVKQEGGLGELGLYMAAYSLCAVLITISALLYNVTIPVLSASTNLQEKQTAIKRTIFLFWLAATGLSIPLIALAYPLVKHLLGPEFVNAGGVLALLAMAVGTRIFYTSFGALLIVHDRVWKMALAHSIGEPFFLIVTFFAAPLWGANGLAFAYLVASLINLIFLYRAAAREAGWRGMPLPGIVLTIALLGAAWLIQGIEVFWLALFSTIILVGSFGASAIYLALRYDLLGNMIAKVPFLMRSR